MVIIIVRRILKRWQHDCIQTVLPLPPVPVVMSTIPSQYVIYGQYTYGHCCFLSRRQWCFLKAGSENVFLPNDYEVNFIRNVLICLGLIWVLGGGLTKMQHVAKCSKYYKGSQTWNAYYSFSKTLSMKLVPVVGSTWQVALCLLIINVYMLYNLEPR
jgi:hypothetical protein